jgi:hypothetical protein
VSNYKIKLLFGSALYAITILLSLACLQAQEAKSARAGLDKEPIVQEKSKAQSKPDTASDTRRAEAVSLLWSLATEAQRFDPRLRSHVQAHVADLLWNVDRPFARDLFLKAWEAAERADHEFDARVKEDRQDLTENSSATVYPPEARREVIFLVKRNDRALGEELLARIAKEYESSEDLGGNETNNISEANVPDSLSPAEIDRLAVARRLLEDGGTEEAVRLAGSTLNRITAPILTFLSQLREKSPAADRFYVALLARAANDSRADGNTVSLLSSYVFSPGLYLTIRPSGFPSSVQTSGLNTQVDVSPMTRSAFLSAARQILLRPLPQLRDGEDVIAQRVSYMVITRLLPLFEQFDSTTAIQLRSRLTELSVAIPARLKSPEIVSRIRRGVDSQESKHQDIQEMLEEANRLTNSMAQDRVYIRAAVESAERGAASAPKTVEKINSEELRKRVLVYVYMALAKRAVESKNVKRAIELARAEELTPIQRVWVYLETARTLGTKHPAEAAEVLFEAASVARRIAGGDPDSARAIVGIATQLVELDRERAKEYVLEAITAANKADRFNGEDTTIEVALETPGGMWAASYGTQNFALKSLFRKLALEDFFQAIDTARNLNGEGPRAVAMIAIANSVLQKNKPGAGQH